MTNPDPVPSSDGVVRSMDTTLGSTAAATTVIWLPFVPGLTVCVCGNVMTEPVPPFPPPDSDPIQPPMPPPASPARSATTSSQTGRPYHARLLSVADSG